jgi:protein tyrosine/serine phosphatase
MRDQTLDDWSTQAGRRRAFWHDILFDHAYLRLFWTNFHEIVPGVFRANHPPPARLERYIAKNRLRAVLNLRGKTDVGHYHAERAVCDAHDVMLVDIKLNARKAPKKEKMLSLIAALKSLQTPFLIHCKSGADRAGLVSVLYRLIVLGHPLPEARKELSLRRWHIRQSETGILDHVLDLYGAAHDASGISFEDWVRKSYDHTQITQSFKSLSWWQR